MNKKKCQNSSYIKLVFKEQIPQNILINFFEYTKEKEFSEISDKFGSDKIVLNLLKSNYYFENKSLSELIVKNLKYIHELEVQTIIQLGTDTERLKVNLLKQICAVKFEKLQYLELYYKRLQNIEAISWIYCPNILGIALECNFITNLQSLVKMDSPKLYQIDISGNRCFNDQNFKSILRIKRKKMRTIQFKGFGTPLPICLRQIAKMEYHLDQLRPPDLEYTKKNFVGYIEKIQQVLQRKFKRSTKLFKFKD